MQDLFCNIKKKKVFGCTTIVQIEIKKNIFQLLNETIFRFI